MVKNWNVCALALVIAGVLATPALANRACCLPDGGCVSTPLQMLVAGKPLNETIARAGPFVMNTEAELRQAFSDYQSGKF